MKLYLQPRMGGIKDLDTFIKGVRYYMEDSEIFDVKVRGLEGTESFESARYGIRTNIDAGFFFIYTIQLSLISQTRSLDDER